MDEEIREEKGDLTVTPSGSEATEQQTITAAKAGDKAAFGRLIRSNQKRLFRFIYGLCGSFDQTEDIVQEAFVKAYAALDRFEAGRPFYPWLATIARNLAFNQMERDKKSQSLDEIREQGFDTASDEPGPIDRLMSSENQKRFFAALKSLPEPYRKVFVLRQFEEMSYQEIGDALKIAPGTVDSRLHRARQMLMEALRDLLEG